MEKTTQVTAKLIIEMLGTPKEHVEKTLHEYVASLTDDKKITVIQSDFAPAEEKAKLFSAFVDLTLKFHSVAKLLDFCFAAMPSSIEIIEPHTLIFDSGPFTDTLNDLQGRLHTLDMEMKQLTAQINIVDQNAVNVLHNFIRYLTKDGGKTPQQMTPVIGISSEQLKAFLDKMVEQGKLVERDGTYTKP